MADQRALLWARTVGQNSQATGRGWAAGDRWLPWHQESRPHISLGLGERRSWPPPQLLLVLQINCFRLSCLLPPQPSSCCNTSAGQ